MSSEGTGVFTKENLDFLLKELAKEFKRRNGTAVPADSVSFINDALERGSYEAVYAAVIEEEKNSKDMLVRFGEKYPGVTTQSNVNEILASLKAKKPPIIGQLRESREQQGMPPGSK